MRKYIMIILVIIGLIAGLYLANKNRTCPLSAKTSLQQEHHKNALIDQALELLRVRKDKEAQAIYEQLLAMHPDDTDALWGKAELLRRQYQLAEAEKILSQILTKEPGHLPSLNNLAYIRYKQDRIKESLDILNLIINDPHLDNENRAFYYITLSSINSKRSSKGLLFNKLQYGTQIKRNLDKAKALCPDLAETHLALGIYFLKAPALAGGNVNKAIDELQKSIKIAPDYALAYARLAQAYLKKGDLIKYDFYLKKAKELDPEGNALKECEI